MRFHLHLTDLRFHRRSPLPDCWTLSTRRRQFSPLGRGMVMIAALLCVLAAAPAASAHSVAGELTPVAGLAPVTATTFLDLPATAEPAGTDPVDAAPAPTVADTAAAQASTPAPAVAAPAPVVIPAPDPHQIAVDTAIAAAVSKIGSPYSYGSAGPYAFDCSGFTRWVYQQAGIELPQYSGAQWALVQQIPLDQLQPGDLVFNWGSGAGAPDHVGLYVGDGMMIHAPSAGNRVRYDSIHWWTGAGLAAGRLR